MQNARASSVENDLSSLIPNATSCCHYNKDKDKSIDENYFLQVHLVHWRVGVRQPTDQSVGY